MKNGFFITPYTLYKRAALYVALPMLILYGCTTAINPNTLSFTTNHNDAEETQYNHAIKTNTIDTYEHYLSNFHQGKYYNIILSKLEDLSYRKVTKENSIDGYEKFLRRFNRSTTHAISLNDFIEAQPVGKYTDKIHLRLELLYFSKHSSTHTIASYTSFLSKYPSGTLAEKATHKLATLLPEGSPPKLATYIRQLHSRSPKKRGEAALKLNKFQERSAPAAASLITLLNDQAPATYSRPNETNSHYTVADIAMSSLIRIGKPSIPTLITALRHNNPTIRSRSALILGKLQAAAAVKPLINLMDDNNNSVRRSAAISLGMIGEEKATPALVNALEDRSITVIFSALDALVSINKTSSIDPIIHLLENKNRIILDKAILTLLKLDNAIVKNKLTHELSKNDSPIRRNLSHFNNSSKHGNQTKWLSRMERLGIDTLIPARERPL